VVPNQLWAPAEPFIPPAKTGPRVVGCLELTIRQFTAIVFGLTSGCMWQQGLLH
jgi:transposase